MWWTVHVRLLPTMPQLLVERTCGWACSCFPQETARNEKALWWVQPEPAPAAANLWTSVLCSLGGKKCICVSFLTLCLLASGNDKDVESQAMKAGACSLLPALSSAEGSGHPSRSLRSDQLTRKEGMIRVKFYLCTDQSKALLTEVPALGI